MLLIRRCWGRGYDVLGKVDEDVKADGEKGRVGNVGAKRSAVRELTCSQSLNSSALTSSLSVWGRWISQTLH